MASVAAPALKQTVGAGPAVDQTLMVCQPGLGHFPQPGESIQPQSGGAGWQVGIQYAGVSQGPMGAVALTRSGGGETVSLLLASDGGAVSSSSASTADFSAEGHSGSRWGGRGRATCRCTGGEVGGAACGRTGCGGDGSVNDSG
ncbi:MAG: hypothetical protein HC875_05155 [Anaerolineales bacterium]|nr:hypothetical protein [Anaerolineales bacterium]